MIRSWRTTTVTVGQERTSYYTECTKYLFCISIRIAWSNRNYLWVENSPLEDWSRSTRPVSAVGTWTDEAPSEANPQTRSCFSSTLTAQLTSLLVLALWSFGPYLLVNSGAPVNYPYPHDNRSGPPSLPVLSTCSVNEVNVLAPWWVSAKVTFSDVCCNPLASVLCTHTRAFSIIQRAPRRRRQRDDIHHS